MTLNRQQKHAGLAALATTLTAGFWVLFHQWDPADAANAQHYHKAMLEVREAISYANAKGGMIDAGDAKYLVGRYEEATRQASLVHDHVLAKLHSDLPVAWHDLFVPSTQVYIRALQSQDRQLARQASLLQDDWVRWLRLNGHQLEVPRAPSEH